MRSALHLLRWAAIALALAWSIGPIVLVVASSFTGARDIFATPPSLFFTPTLDSYRELWANHPAFFRGLWSSLLVTAGATVVTLAAACAAGYVYARHHGHGRIGAGIKPGDADDGIGFIDGAIRGDPQIVFGHPIAIAERGFALVAAAGIDAGEFDHTVVTFSVW